MRSPGLNFTEVVKNLIIINVLFFVATDVFPELLSRLMPEGRGFRNVTDFLGMHYFDSPKFEPFQIITHMFSHGGFMHILFNMLGLFFLGPALEMSWGAKRFLTFYFVAGFGALAAHILFGMIRVYNIAGEFTPNLNEISQVLDPASSQTLANIYYTPMVGASGAIYGVFVAFAMTFPNVKMMVIPIPVPIKAKYLVMAMLGFDLFFGVAQYSGDSIAHFAHLGGALTGFLLLMYWGRR